MLAIGVQPRVEQRPASRVLDQKYWDRHGDVALTASIKWANSPVTVPQVKA
jgi:hypothetical protein